MVLNWISAVVMTRYGFVAARRIRLRLASAYQGMGLRDIGVSPQINLLTFDGPPEPLDEDVVPRGALPIHAVLDLVLHQQAREGAAAKLGAGLQHPPFNRSKNRFRPGKACYIGYIF